MFWNNYKYKIKDNEIILLEYGGEEKSVCIPSEIDGCPVTEIGGEAFSEYGSGIERIEVPETVRVIGDHAFKMCMSLTELILHEGLLEIGKGVLDVTSITNIHIPSTVRHIKRPYELGDFSWEIGENNPFYHTDGYALYDQKDGCKSLVAVQKQDERTEYQAEEGTSRVGCNAFEGQVHLQRLILPKTVAVVEEDAFESCQNLREIFLPEGLQKIGADVFRHCVSLKELWLPSTLHCVGERALTDTFGWSDKMNGISRIVAALHNPVFETDENALYRREEDGTVTLIKYFGREREFVIPETVSQVGEGAFRRSNVKNLVIPESVSVIQRDAFRECKDLESVLIRADQVLLYVPRTPVYRKDEVAAPFYTLSNEVRPLRQEYTAMHAPNGTGGQDPSGDGKRQPCIYDYTKYDKLIETWSQILERCRMACFRLKYPLELDEELQSKYRNLILEKLTEILVDISEREDLEYLAELAGLGIFTSDNIDGAIDVVSRCRKAKLTGYLMDYKQEHLEASEFDFSL